MTSTQKRIRTKDQLDRQKEIYQANRILFNSKVNLKVYESKFIANYLQEELQLRSRKDAFATGIPFYFTGKECPNGHLSIRNTITAKCVACSREKEKRRYQRLAGTEYYINSERNQQVYESRKKRKAERPTLYSVRHVEYRAMYRGQRKVQTPPWLTKEQVLEIRATYRKARAKTDAEGIVYHVDHIIPLKGKEVSGLHVPWNLRIIPATENVRKNNKHTEIGV